MRIIYIYILYGQEVIASKTKPPAKFLSTQDRRFAMGGEPFGGNVDCGTSLTSIPKQFHAALRVARAHQPRSVVGLASRNDVSVCDLLILSDCFFKL